MSCILEKRWPFKLIPNEANSHSFEESSQNHNIYQIIDDEEDEIFFQKPKVVFCRTVGSTEELILEHLPNRLISL